MKIDIYIGTRAVACASRFGARWSESVDGFDQALASVGEHLRQRRAWIAPRVRLWWSGGLCRTFTFAVPTTATEPNDIQNLADALASQRCDLSEPSRTWAEHIRPGLALAATVTEDTWHRSVAALTLAVDEESRVIWAAPWWSLVLRHAVATKRAHNLVRVRDCDSLTILSGDAQGVTSVKSCTPVIDDRGAQQAWLRARSLSSDATPALKVRVSMTLSALASKEDPGPQSEGGSIGLWGRVEA
jgi:hypothetical protein